MQPQTTVEEPQGIPFFSIRTGETHWCKLEPTISAYINSSDMGINASREQDYGWRLAPEWVQKVRKFKRNRQEMANLTTRNQGQKPTTVQILYYMYGEQLQAYYESMEENENPYEEEYMKMINQGSSRQEAAEAVGIPLALADFQSLGEDDEEDDDMADLIDDVIADDEEEPTATEADKEVAAELAKQEEPTTKPAANKKSTRK